MDNKAVSATEFISPSKNSNCIVTKEKIYFSEYKFFSIKNSKTPLYAILHIATGKIYLKGRVGFLDDIYYLMKDEKYTEGSVSLIHNLKYIYDGQKMSDRVFISHYLDNNDLIKLVDDVTFKPVDKRIIYEDGGVFLNEYTPTQYLSEKFNNGNKNEGIFPFIRQLLLNLCAGDIKGYEYLLKVLSLSIKTPWIKRHGYIVFQGEGASGKGTFFDLIMTPIFKDYCIVDTEEVLRTQFNEYSHKALWVFIEEKDDTQNRQKGSLSSTLKYVSGNTKGVTEKKGMDRKTTYDYRNWGMTSNKYNLGLDLDKDDRRATIFGYSQSLGGHIDQSPRIRKMLEKNIPKELPDFVSYLKNLEFEQNEVFVCYKTEARRNLIELDMDNTALFINEIKNYSGGEFCQIIKDYKFSDKIDKKEIDLEEKENNFNMTIHRNTNGEDFLLLSSLYSLFRNYCELNNKHPVGANKFSTEFSYSTRINKERKSIDGKQKMVIRMDKFLKYFNLRYEENNGCYNIAEFNSK